MAGFLEFTRVKHVTINSRIYTEPGHAINPATGAVFAEGPMASAPAVDDAVAAAKAAVPQWSTATPAERSQIMYRWAQELEQVATALAEAETTQAGKPIKLTTEFDVP